MPRIGLPALCVVPEIGGRTTSPLIAGLRAPPPPLLLGFRDRGVPAGLSCGLLPSLLTVILSPYAEPML